MFMELRRKRTEIADKLRALLNKASGENRDLTDEEKNTYDNLMAEVRSLADRIEREEQVNDLEARVNRPHQEPTRPDVSGNDHQEPERVYRSFGEQLMDVRQAALPGRTPPPRLFQVRATGAGEGTPSDGGFLVQHDFAAELMKRTYDTGVIASRCRRIPISAAANGLKMNMIEESSRANGSRWGGIQAYWTGEAGTLAATKPKFSQVDLSLQKLTGLCYATDELLMDATALEAVVMQGFAEEFGFKSDDAVIRGSGAGMPLGVLNAGCLVSVAKEANQAATTIVTENVIKMWARMWARSRPNAVWLINQDIEPQLYTMSLNVGTGGVPVYMPAGGLSGAPYGTLMARPVLPVEYCASLGTVGDIILADFSQYLLIDKGPLQRAASIHVQFLTDETVFRFIYRLNGQPLWNSALTPFQGTGNTVGPFVVLATRS